MFKISGMKKLTRENRLQGDSLKEITQAYEQALLDLGRDIDAPKRSLSHGPFLNALVCRFLAMDARERVAFARESLKAFAAIRDENSSTDREPRVHGATVIETSPANRSAKPGRNVG